MQALRSLVPSVPIAALLAAALVACIRLRPLAMPHALQVSLAACLVVAAGGVIAAVWQYGRGDGG